jgi:hypothetical protein
MILLSIFLYSSSYSMLGPLKSTNKVSLQQVQKIGISFIARLLEKLKKPNKISRKNIEQPCEQQKEEAIPDRNLDKLKDHFLATKSGITYY